MSDLEGGVRLPNSDRRDSFEPFGSSFRPNWRESGAQLTEKQAVLLMHDIYTTGITNKRQQSQNLLAYNCTNAKVGLIK